MIIYKYNKTKKGGKNDNATKQTKTNANYGRKVFKHK